MDLYFFVMFGDFGRFLEIFRILPKYPQKYRRTLIWGNKCVFSRFFLSLSNLVARVIEINRFVFFVILGDFGRFLEIFRSLPTYPQKYRKNGLGQKMFFSRFFLSLSNLVAGVLEIHGFVCFRDVWRFWKILGNIQKFA